MGGATRSSRIVATVCGATVLALVATGCSNGAESSRAKQSARRWADTVCTELARWIDTAETGPPATTAEAALRLRSGIARAEPPDTDDGLAAQGEMDKLATAIEQAVRDADPSDIATTAAEARGAIGAIRGLTPGGAVENALDTATACRALRT